MIGASPRAGDPAGDPPPPRARTMAPPVMMRRLTPALLLLLAACPGPAQPGPGDIPLKSHPYDPAVDGPGAQGADRAAAEAGHDDAVDVKPVYGEPVPELAEARKLCDALYLLPAERSGLCCNSGGASKQSKQIADECTQALSSAVAGGGVVIRDDNLESCIAGLEAANATCEYVGPWGPPLPPGCLDVTHGTLAAAARCRSSRECLPGLHCAGVGPTDPGVCAPAAEDGTLCNAAVDTLATYLRDDSLTDHPVCSGRCVKRRCQPALAEGAACSSNSECATGLHCDGKTCIAGATAAAGEPCADSGCAAGSLCLQHVCVAQGTTGASCKTDFECRGACIKGPDGASRCGPKC
jgi:hypothetical protein